MHSYVLNNEEIISCAPTIAKRKNDKEEFITIYGDKKSMSPGIKVAMSIYEKFPKNLDCGTTDIIAVDNKILMMIRDKGHALSFDIDIEEEKAMVNYFIPKICNEEMVKKLKGIAFVSDEMHGGARGRYEVTTENLSDELFEFIDGVPTDSDIPRIRHDFENVASIDEIEHDAKENFSIDNVRELAKDRELKGVMKIFETFKKAVTRTKNKGKDVDTNER